MVDATSKQPLTALDVLHMCRKFMTAAHYQFTEDMATANWLVEHITTLIGPVEPRPQSKE